MFPRFVFWLLIGLVVAMPATHVLGSTGGESEAVSLNPLSWEWIQQDLAIWTAVVFLLLLLVLSKFAWKPLAEGLDQRENHIANEIAEAEAANLKAKEILEGYDRKLADAGQQVREVLDQGRRDAEKIGHELIEKAKAEAHAEQQRGVQQIEAAAAAALKDLADQSATMAVGLAGKIVQAKLNPSDHSQLIEQAVTGFARQKDRAGQN